MYINYEDMINNQKNIINKVKNTKISVTCQTFRPNTSLIQLNNKKLKTIQNNFLSRYNFLY